MNYKVITNTNKKSIVPVSKKLIPSLTCLIFLACQHSSHVAIEGTWRLVSATSITGGVSASTVDTTKTSMIKIINRSHFAFLKHDLHAPRDSSNHFESGGGTYTLQGDQYIEHLEYCGDPAWEGHSFSFTVSMHSDTLVQRGREKVEGTGIDREIIERYVRTMED